jgi:hypothetical protein
MAIIMLDHILSIIGAFFLVFRIWLVEYKLEDELQFRKNYVSRILNYYFCIALLLAFRAPIFNLAIIGALPMMVISFVGWDSLFFIKFKKRTYWKKNHGWLLLERITLHPPMIPVAIWMYYKGFQNFVPPPMNPWVFVAVGILFFGPFLLMDKRWTEKYIAPTGNNILFGAVLSYIFIVVFAFVFF